MSWPREGPPLTRCVFVLRFRVTQWHQVVGGDQPKKKTLVWPKRVSLSPALVAGAMAKATWGWSSASQRAQQTSCSHCLGLSAVVAAACTCERFSVDTSTT